MHGLTSIPSDQAWFWTAEWQAGEQEASDQLARGEGTVHTDTESFLESLH